MQVPCGRLQRRHEDRRACRQRHPPWDRTEPVAAQALVDAPTARPAWVRQGAPARRRCQCAEQTASAEERALPSAQARAPEEEAAAWERQQPAQASVRARVPRQQELPPWALPSPRAQARAQALPRPARELALRASVPAQAPAPLQRRVPAWARASVREQARAPVRAPAARPSAPPCELLPAEAREARSRGSQVPRPAEQTRWARQPRALQRPLPWALPDAP